MSRFATRQQITQANNYAYDLGAQHARAGKHANPFDRVTSRAKYFEYEEGHRNAKPEALRAGGEA